MKTIRTFILFVALAFVSVSACAQQPAFIKDSLDAYINREMKNWELPGMAVAIVKDGKVVLSKGYGVKEAGKNDPVNDETLFQIASCSKAFTSTALAMLHVEKKLSLDDTVRRWMPGFRMKDQLATRQVTIRDLLCNRLGLMTFQGDMVHWGSDLTRQQIIDLMAMHEPQFGFRARYGYCNAAFLAAGEIIPLVTGISWDDYVSRNFFSPLGMKRSSTTSTMMMKDNNVCKPHSKWNGQQIVLPYDNIDNLGPAASIVSCVKDLTAWIRCQLDSGKFNGKQIIPFAALQETRKPHTIMNDPSSLFPGMHFQMYGLGWQMADFYGKKIYYHGGAADGFLSHVCFVPELNLGFVILTNSDQNSLYTALRYQILDAYCGNPYRNYSSIFLSNTKKNEATEAKQIAEWEKKANEKKPLPFNAKELIGAYRNTVYGQMTIDIDATGNFTAFFEHHKQIRATVRYMSDSTFIINYNTPMWGIRTMTVHLEQGKPESITLSINEFVDYMPYTFRKYRAATPR